MSAAQWIALLALAAVCLTCLVALVRTFDWSPAAPVEVQLAEIVAAEEAEVDSWLRLARVVGVLDPGTPIYDRLVCDQIEEQEGWAS